MPQMSHLTKHLADEMVKDGLIDEAKAREIARSHFRQEISLVALIALATVLLVAFSHIAGGA